MAVSPTLIRGSIQLVLDCVSGITTAAESMHQTIATSATSWLHPLSSFWLLKEIRKPTAYAVVRTASDILNKSVTKSLTDGRAHSELRSLDSSEIRYAAVLNGICGDHFEERGNVLAIPMEFVRQSDMLAASPHIVVLVHGLCLAEDSWQKDGHPGMGEHLKRELGMDPVYLRYNTGRRVSTNGKELSRQLDDLLAAWPVPVESLSLVGYSMGGLVIRSACWYADTEQRSWLKFLTRIVFLGAPHHGSPVEKAGHLLDTAMQSVKHVEPLSFGRKRSAGIKDLRHGNLLDDDWDRPAGEKLGLDTRKYVPLPPSVDHYFIAASIGRHDRDPLGHIFGDLLVRVGSALGTGSNSPGDLEVKEENCRVFQEKTHFDLVNDDRVLAQVIEWFRKPFSRFHLSAD
jgi:pimeloyl-ACP methyl ester carboxylesterase